MPKLLVIEDDREINHLICEYMAEAGYEMLSASNGLEGLSMLERIKDIDLCLLDLVLDDQAKIVRVNGNKIDLTVKEYGILKLLLENPKKLFSKANLFESVWNETYYPEDNALKVHMSNLRTKIKKYDDREYIETVWGMGYKLADGFLTFSLHLHLPFLYTGSL